MEEPFTKPYDSQLVMGCLENNVELVRNCLNNGARADEKLLNGRRLLGLAAEKGSVDVMRLLLDRNDETPVSDSTDYPNNFNGNVTPDGMSDLEWDGEMLEDFSISGVESDPTSCLYIWYASILAKTQPFLKDVVEDLDAQDAFGRNALHYAAKEGHLNAVELLLESGCSVNAMDRQNTTPLYLAVENNRPQVLKRLLDHGAYHNYESLIGCTELHVCATHGFYECAEILISAGWSVNATGTDNFKPLHLAVAYGHRKIVKLLLKNDAKINAATLWEDTALIIAINNSDLEMARLLVKYGAKFKQVDSFYRLLNQFIALHRTDFLEILLQARGYISLNLEIGGGTPLWFAIQTGNPKSARILLDNGASLACNMSSSTGAELFFAEIVPKLNINCTLLITLLKAFDENGWVIPECATQSSFIFGNRFSRSHSTFLLLRLHGEGDFKMIRWNPQNHVVEDFFREFLILSNIIQQKTLENAYQPLRLFDYARNTVRESLGDKLWKKVKSLPLPKQIQKFLLYDEINCGCIDTWSNNYVPVL